MAYQYLEARTVAENLRALCNPNVYTLILHKHLGDVFYAIGAKDAFEKTYGESLHFVVRPAHEFLMKLWGVSNYVVFDLDLLVKKNHELIDNYFHGQKPDKAALDRLENEFFQAIFSCIPIKGEPFVCENPINNFFSYPRYWCYRWATNMGIEEDFRFAIPKGDLLLSKNAIKAVEKLGGLNKIVLVAPEAATAIELPPELWHCVSRAIHAKGLIPLVNSKRIKLPFGVSTFEYNLSLEEIVSIGLKCHSVISLRSGLCDVLVGAKDNLTTISPAMLRREDGSLSKPFASKTGVHEIQFANWQCPEFIWYGEDFQKPFQKIINNNRIHFWKECISCLISSSGSHTFWRRLLNNLFGSGRVFPDNNVENINRYRLVKLGILPVYESYSSLKNNEEVKFKKIFGGLYCKTSTDNSKKHSVFGIPLVAIKKRQYTVVKVLGIPVFFKNRGEEFKLYLEDRLRGLNGKYSNLIILRHNLGENTIYLSLLKEWIRSSKLRKPALVVWRQKDLPLYNLYLGLGVDLVQIPISQSDINSFFKKEKSLFGDIVIHSPTFRIAESMKAAYKENKNINFVNFIKKSIKIAEVGDFTLPTPTKRAKEKASMFLQQNIPEGMSCPKYVLICPEATSLKLLSTEFWQALTNELTKRKFVVFVNQIYSPQKLKGAIPCSLPLDELYSFCIGAEGIVSLASGLGVLLSLSGVKCDLIYTDFRSKSIGYSSKLTKQIYSVGYIPCVDMNIVSEYDANSIEEEEVLKEILKKYS